MIKYLITGGAGYIGSVLTEELLKDKNNILTIVDNFYYGQSSLSHLLHFKNLELINTDVREINKYEKAVKTSDIIIPLSALVGAPICDKYPTLAREINFSAITELFKLTSNDQSIIMPTTNSAYGKGEKNGYCDENSPLYPLSQYAKDKVELEKILLNRKNVISLRLATVFGTSARMRLDLLVNDFVHKAYFDRCIVLFESDFRRNYIHIRDVARCFKHVIANFNDMKDEIYNVGLSDANLTKKELTDEIKSVITDTSIFFSENKSDPDQRDYIVSNDKIEAKGFEPIYTIKDGIIELIKFYKTIKRNNFSNI